MNWLSLAAVGGNCGGRGGDECGKGECGKGEWR